MKICGIYKIENKENDRVIVGSSADIKQRWSNYKSLLDNGTYCNKELQADWDIYGSDKFVFEVLETCLQKDLYVQESFWQEVYAVSLHGYNKNKIIKLTKDKDKTKKTATKKRLEFSGMNHPHVSITDEDVFRIRALLNLEYSAMEINNMTNINYGIIYKIKNKIRWANVVSTEYDGKDVDYLLAAY